MLARKQRLELQSPLWQNPAFWRLMLQGYLILPLLGYCLTLLRFSAVDELTKEVAFKVAVGVVFGVAFGIALDMSLGVAFGVAFGIAGGVAFDVAGGVGYCASIIFYFYRSFFAFPLLFLWHTFIYRLDQKRSPQKLSLLRYNAAFSDEFQFLRLPGLDKHLLLILDRNPAEGQAALNYLLDTPQKWAAQGAQLELEFRKLERCQDIISLSQVHQILAEDLSPNPSPTRRGESNSHNISDKLSRI